MRKRLASILLGATIVIGIVLGTAQTSHAASATPAGCNVQSTQVGTTVAATLGSRSYLIHIPRSARTGHPVPLILAFHGRSNSAAEFDRLSGFSQRAERGGFVVVYPQGEFGPDNVTGWNTGRVGHDPSSDDVGFVESLLAHVQESYCIDEKRIYAVGYSNGGGLVAILACRDANRFAAFAPVAGDYMAQPGGCHPTQPVSILEIHGDGDTVNPYNGSTTLGLPSVGDWLRGWADLDGCSGDPRILHPRRGVTLQTWATCADHTTVAGARLAGVGHVWRRSYASNVWAFFRGISR